MKTLSPQSTGHWIDRAIDAADFSDLPLGEAFSQNDLALSRVVAIRTRWATGHCAESSWRILKWLQQQTVCFDLFPLRFARLCFGFESSCSKSYVTPHLWLRCNGRNIDTATCGFKNGVLRYFPLYEFDEKDLDFSSAMPPNFGALSAAMTFPTREQCVIFQQQTARAFVAGWMNARDLKGASQTAAIPESVADYRTVLRNFGQSVRIT